VSEAPDHRQVPVGGEWGLVSVAAGYVTLLVLVPLVALAVSVVHTGVGAVLIELWQPAARQAWLTSLLLAAIAVLINAPLGVIGGLVLVRHKFWGRRVLDVLVDLPLSVSPVMSGLAIIAVFGREGFMRPVLDVLSLQVTYAFPALVIATVFVTLPFVVREVGYVLTELGDSEELAAATLGASSWQTFWRVTLPKIRRGLGYGLSLTLARALGEFGAVLMVGGAIAGKTGTATTFIYAAFEERREGVAFGLALMLGLVSVLVLTAVESRHRVRKPL